MLITSQLQMDLQKCNEPVWISAMQEDTNTRCVEIHLYNDNQPWIIPDGIAAAIGFQKPDGTRGLYDRLPDGNHAITMSENTLSVILVPQMMTVPGLVRTAVTLYDSDRNQLSTFPFCIRVETNPAAGVIVSENYCYYTSVADINEALNAALAKMDETVSNVENKLNNGDFHGKSAYEYAKESGYTGTEEAFSKALASSRLDDAAIEKLVTAYLAEHPPVCSGVGAKGDPGPKGDPGMSAYDYAVLGGYEGSESDFVQKLSTDYLPIAGGSMAGQIDMDGNPINGLNMPTANDQAANMGFVNQQVKKAAPRNLLDNSDWRVKELIVNQRGYTKWTRDAKPETGADATTQYGITNAGAYTVDRWKTYVDIGTINLVSNGIELDATSNAITFGQRLDNAVSSRMFASGKKYTVAIHYTVTTAGSNITLFQGLKDNAVKAIGTLNKTVGMHTAVFVFTPNGASGNNTYCPFHLYVQSGNKLILHWAALYEGEYTAETLPEYQPKGYSNELLECQRYFTTIKTVITTGYTFGSMTTAQCFVSLSIPLRTVNTTTVPTIGVKNIGSIRGNGIMITPTAVRTGYSLVTNGGIVLEIDGDYSTVGAAMPVVYMGMELSISADL